MRSAPTAQQHGQSGSCWCMIARPGMKQPEVVCCMLLRDTCARLHMHEACSVHSMVTAQGCLCPRLLAHLMWWAAWSRERHPWATLRTQKACSVRSMVRTAPSSGPRHAQGACCTSSCPCMHPHLVLRILYSHNCMLDACCATDGPELSRSPEAGPLAPRMQMRLVGVNAHCGHRGQLDVILCTKE